MWWYKRRERERVRVRARVRVRMRERRDRSSQFVVRKFSLHFIQESKLTTVKDQE
ncbi:predicted protein [Sclerotinia sclerotiorum 1980 UF-70]|uniref:Uncharacterized protein n=1 Tax=Sclerotinia sclerotiorum (strain ATCC 18683 / 1980 / Ss-1) TaxID=665079 RepID=A7F1F8_SCLS1|nr:predicted protein [Sclerotinia sclerotiorum 1980 UF-70]EDN95550.1 predicted protein [Sclerotinia sclerotiorum 1980 UF-70]